MQLVSAAQAPQVWATEMPQICPLAVQSAEVSWQFPVTHWPLRQMSLVP